MNGRVFLLRQIWIVKYYDIYSAKTFVLFYEFHDILLNFCRKSKYLQSTVEYLTFHIWRSRKTLLFARVVYSCRIQVWISMKQTFQSDFNQILNWPMIILVKLSWYNTYTFFFSVTTMVFIPRLKCKLCFSMQSLA